MTDSRAASPVVLSPGALVADRWELEGAVSNGSRSEVWRARDLRLERTVALKVMRSELLHDRRALRGFERQLQLLGRVENPHVMRIFDAVVDDGRLMLICELVDGLHLDHILDRRDGLSPDEVVALGVQLAHGLATMHEQSLVHRDVNPHNVIVTSDGTVKLLGVGSVKWIHADSTITDRASLLAGAAYLAPEQLNGVEVDPRIDVYAVGVVLWEAVTGQRPPEMWTAEDPLAADHVLERASSVRRGVPSELDDLLWRATAVDPEERFADAEEMADELAELAAPRPTEVTRRLQDR